MKASETQFQRVIEGTNQFLVPHFQRPYSWTQRQWQTLWDDLAELADLDAGATSGTERPRQHFMGSIVTMPGQSVPEGITKYVLIDGQQRLTTLLILLAALRDAARNAQPRLAEEIHDLYLSNRHRDGREKFKLLPTQGDRLRHADDPSSIGIILCKAREKVTVEYALRDTRKPMGVSQYRLTQALPDELESSFPSVAQLEDELRRL